MRKPLLLPTVLHPRRPAADLLAFPAPSAPSHLPSEPAAPETTDFVQSATLPGTGGARHGVVGPEGA